MEISFDIKKLTASETQTALDLAWKVFQEYEAPDYSKEGVEEFYRSIQDDNYLAMLSLYGAFVSEKLVGVIATRNEGTHIALFFVDGEYHRNGIGKKLFQTVLSQCSTNRMTVNSSPYAVPVYHKLGFTDIDTEQVINGLRFTPMEYKF